MTGVDPISVADVHAHTRPSLRTPILWGLVFGALQAALPLGFAWLEPATVQALLLCFIAAVYVGFAVADGRPRVIAIEIVIAAGVRRPTDDRISTIDRIEQRKATARQQQRQQQQQ